VLFRCKGRKTLKRLPGVIFSAVVLLFGSLFQLLMATLMALGGVIEKSQIHSKLQTGPTSSAPIPSWMPVFMWVFCGFFVALAGWGILTSVGLFRMRRWARYSILIIGGCLAVFGLVQTLTSLVLTVVPLPVPTNVDPSQANTMPTMMKFVFGAMAAIYGIVTAVGISWLVYFNQKRVREPFATGMGQIVPSPRPVLISVLAVLNLIGGPSCLLMAFLPLPGLVLGFLLYGWQRAAVYLVLGILSMMAGVGLWRLDERGRRLAIALPVLGALQNVVYIARPSLMTSYISEFNRSLNIPQTPMPAQFQTVMYSISFGAGTLFLIAILAILHHYRDAFKHPPESSQIESAATL
jgi:hypothetical protein